MSAMSDSDDTDILLLIPPDYYQTATEQQLQLRNQHNNYRKLHQLKAEYQQLVHTMTDPSNINLNVNREYNEIDEIVKDTVDTLAMPSPQTTTPVFMFLPPEKKAELNHINSCLHTMEQHGDFATASDISTISTSTVHTQLRRNQVGRPDTFGLVHSTPKCTPQKWDSRSNMPQQQKQREFTNDGVLLEIDNFFEDREERRFSAGIENCHHRRDGYQLSKQRQPQPDEIMSTLGAVQTSSLPDELNRLSLDQPVVSTHLPAAVAVADNNLISLSEIWGQSGQATAIAVGATKSSFKEEQLRRQHLEKRVHMLHSRLLEYQQRLSVAIEVDRAKDGALSSAQLECKRSNLEVQQLHDALLKTESVQQEHTNKMDLMQKELSQAVNLASKFQEKHERLETELAASSRKISDNCNIYKRQAEELEIKLHASERSEEIAINEVRKIKDTCSKAEFEAEKSKTRSDELEKECSILRQQKQTLQELHHKQKGRADALETQKKSLQDSLTHSNLTESVLKRKLELQQKSLKAHYQQQLEHVVAQKMKEFQAQLDKTEETLKAEARDRERLIAERAVKQLELLNEKSDLELSLLQEKHAEEVSLYRIQLANASKRIEELETKLSCYKSKRVDIAEKLHDVMETQWQKALEILTSPNQSRQAHASSDMDSPENNETHKHENDYNENCNFQTPKSNKIRGASSKENNLNVEKSNEQPAPMDRLQAYIELLLNKSPSDFEKLDEILALSRKSRSNGCKFSRSSSKRINNGKPPWKA